MLLIILGLKLLVPLLIISCWITLLIICFMTKLLSWMLMTPLLCYLFYLQVTSLPSFALNVITILYYKFLFDQNAEELKSISQSELLTRIHKANLCEYINQHYNLANQIHILNSWFNAGAFGVFISLSVIQMLLLNIIIKQTYTFKLRMLIFCLSLLFFFWLARICFQCK